MGEEFRYNEVIPGSGKTRMNDCHVGVVIPELFGLSPLGHIDWEYMAIMMFAGLADEINFIITLRV
ncbi:hypothetical protein ACEQ8H_003346 [Pleosporales sp. CAS-2024a]